MKKHQRRGRSRKKGGAPRLPSAPVTVTVESLGAQGDGLGRAGGQTYYLPLTVPGETVTAKVIAKRGDGWRCQVTHTESPSADRVTPPCPHYGTCGGCTLQHIAEPVYRDWKRNLVITALKRQGLTPEVLPLQSVPPGSRRRATFEALMTANGPIVGFNQRLGKQVIDIDTCPLMVSDLNALLPALKEAIAAFSAPGERGDIAINMSDTGPDITFIWPGGLDRQRLEALSQFADAKDVARVSWRDPKGQEPELVVQRHPAVLSFGKASVELPAAAFLQPSRAGETLLVKAVLAGLEDTPKNIADLYAGCGSFTFPLATTTGGHVTAFEAAEQQVRALETGAGRANLGGRITGIVRDLARQPLTVKEVAQFETVVFDPPRAGAKEQVEKLALSDVPQVIGVSCNPATFARDARILIDGGYQLESVTPVDQFPFTGHMEVVGVFRK